MEDESSVGSMGPRVWKSNQSVCPGIGSILYNFELIMTEVAMDSDRAVLTLKKDNAGLQGRQSRLHELCQKAKNNSTITTHNTSQ